MLQFDAQRRRLDDGTKRFQHHLIVCDRLLGHFDIVSKRQPNFVLVFLSHPYTGTCDRRHSQTFVVDVVVNRIHTETKNFRICFRIESTHHCFRVLDKIKWQQPVNSMQDRLPLVVPSPAYKTNVADYSMIRDWRNALKTPPTYHRFGNRTFRFNYHFVFLVTCVISLILLFYGLRPSSRSSYLNSITNNDSSKWLSSPNVLTISYNYSYPLTAPIGSNGDQTYRIALIADLDKKSKDDTHKYAWRSYLKKGYLSYSTTKNTVAVTFDNDNGVTEIDSGYSLNGRGMELSELVTFNGRILTFDDRTGIVYELNGDKVIPWVLLMDGTGRTSKGFKSEWATVKDEVLYVGSMGKEWTTSTGEFESFDPMYVKAITTTGEVNFCHSFNLVYSFRTGHLRFLGNYFDCRFII